VDLLVSLAVLRGHPDRLTLGAQGRWIMATDLIAALPASALLGNPSLGLLGVLKLVKVALYMHLWRQRELRIAARLLLVFTLFWLALCGHWISCGWLALRTPAPELDPPAAYVDAVYWTVTTVTSVGYGDVVPETLPQKVFAIVTMVVGLAFFGYIVGVIASTLSKRDPATLRFTEAVEQLSQAARYWKLPRDVERRIYDYHFYVWKKRLGYDEAHFLKTLPSALKAEVALYLKSEVLDKVELFQDADPEFLRDVALRLRPEVLVPGERVVEEGEEGDEMYFVVRGELEVVSRSGTILARLSGGDFFGEIALFTDAPRTATVRALTYCDVYVLSRSAFRYLTRKYPDVHSGIEELARIRAQRTAAAG
jgi:voltage-gated potassium channel